MFKWWTEIICIGSKITTTKGLFVADFGLLSHSTDLTVKLDLYDDQQNDGAFQMNKRQMFIELGGECFSYI